MKISISLPTLPIFCAGAMLLAAPFSSNADDSTNSSNSSSSLFDSSKTRTAPAELQSILGPKSGGIHYDARMLRAAEIAQRRAQPHMTWYCWRYVKNALVDAGLVSSRPDSPWAKQAGEELCRKYGFVKLDHVKNPLDAPIGAVCVYGGADAGHVEIRTATGFVSDFTSRTPYPRPFLGAYVKPS